jgi:diguanylate cyclase (GGDEF)-like protein
MSLRQKLMAVLAIPAIVLIVATALAYQTNARRTEATHLLRRSYEVRNTVDLIVADLSSAESGVRGYLITGDRGMLYPYEAASERLGRHLRELRRLVVDTEAARLARMLDDHADLRLHKLGRLLAYAPVREDERDEVVALAKGGDVTMHHVLGITERLRDRETDLLSERSAELESAERLAFLIRMVGLPVGLLLSGVLVALFAGRLVRRIGSLSENTRRLEQGVPLLDAAAPRDELGQLERTLVTTGTKVMELQGELHRLATVDQLTGLINRRGFLDTATQTMELARRNGTPLALLFVDADGLKTVNDTLGHAVGDELLQELGSLLRDTFRQSDLAARVGGDEFCVLVSADTWEGVATARDRLLAAIEMANNLPGRVYDVSVSVGVAAFDRETDGSIDDLIARADGLMYEEKRAKREEHAASKPAVEPVTRSVDPVTR